MLADSSTHGAQHREKLIWGKLIQTVLNAQYIQREKKKKINLTKE